MTQHYILVKKPEKVEAVAKNFERSNDVFRKFLKGKRSKEVDAVVFELNKTVSQQIDCTQCGNCCKKLNAPFTSKEISRTAPFISLSEAEFTQRHCQHDEMDNVFYIKNPPCVFLKDNKCSVYEYRPDSCAEFPHLKKPNFIFRTLGIFENYKICPIVFNVVELLKVHYRFRY